MSEESRKPNPSQEEGKKNDKGRRMPKKSFKRGRNDDRKPQEQGFVPGNDPAWWKKVPELMKDAANLKSNWIAGTPIDEADIPFVPAGVLAVRYFPGYGVSWTASHPLNVWARDLYLKMFQKWRGITYYEYPDLGITILAQIEVVRMIAKLERIYGIVTRYSKANTNMPYAEAAALDLTVAQADWIRGHLSDYRYDLNELLRKAQRLCIPKDLTVLMDQISLCGYEYIDHENPKGQLILFDCDDFGFYSDTLLQTGGSIKFEHITMTSTIKLIDTTGVPDNMFVALSTMLDALLGSTSVNKVLGDLLTWFGNEQLLTINLLPEDYMIVPTYSESILHKLHNAEGCANTMYCAINNSMDAADITALKASGFVIYQYDNNIICRPTICGSGTANYDTVDGFQFRGAIANITNIIADHNTLIDTYRVDDNEDTVIEGALFKATLKKVSFTSGGNTCYYAKFTSCSFEIILGMSIYKMTVGGTVTSVTVTNVGNNSALVKANAAELAVIDWAPLSYVTTAHGQITEIYGDIDTPIPTAINSLAKIQRAIVYSGLHTDVVVLDKIHQ